MISYFQPKMIIEAGKDPPKPNALPQSPGELHASTDDNEKTVKTKAHPLEVAASSDCSTDMAIDR